MRFGSFGLGFLIATAGCTGGDTASPQSTSTDPTSEFSIQAPTVDTGWPDIGDADTDTDSDTDTDTTDTDVVDTDVVDTDTVDTDTAVCELTFSALVRGPGDVACDGTTTCLSTDALTMTARIDNPCSGDLVFHTNSACLSQIYTVAETTNPTPDTRSPAACGTTGSDITIAAGAHQDEVLTWDPMSAGPYTLTVTFDDAAASQATADFTVVPAP